MILWVWLILVGCLNYRSMHLKILFCFIHLHPWKSRLFKMIYIGFFWTQGFYLCLAEIKGEVCWNKCGWSGGIQGVMDGGVVKSTVWWSCYAFLGQVVKEHLWKSSHKFWWGVYEVFWWHLSLPLVHVHKHTNLHVHTKKWTLDTERAFLVLSLLGTPSLILEIVVIVFW